MSKRFISLFLALVIALSVVAIAPVSAAETDNSAETSANNDWYEVYDDAIWYGYYKSFGNPYYNYTDSIYTPIKFLLHDLDFNGIPELIIYNGAGSVAQGHIYYVHTVKNGSLYYCGSIHNYYPTLFHHMNSSYKGLYCAGGRMGIGFLDYYYMRNYKIIRKEVLFSDDQTNADHSIKRTVRNKTLYNAYKKATKTDKNDYYFGRTERYPAKEYTRSEIYNMGYNNWVGKYQYLAIPKINKFENVSNGVKLSWKAVKGAEKYKVYMKAGSSWKTVGTTKSTSIVHKTDKSGKTYTYTIKCISADGSRATSQFISAGFKNKFIATPKLRSIKNTSSGVRFVFHQVNGASKYRIYRKTSGTSWTKVSYVSSKKDYFLDKTAKKGKTYTYTVRCVSSDGKKHVSGYDKTGLTIKRK